MVSVRACILRHGAVVVAAVLAGCPSGVATLGSSALDGGTASDAGAMGDGGADAGADGGAADGASPGVDGGSCVLSGAPLRFEPSPPGAPRPSTLNWIGVTGFWPYRPSTGGPRMLVTESFGYQIIDLGAPTHPSALGFEDYRFEPQNPGPIPCSGDCHSSIGGYAVSEDGARFGLALNVVQSSAYHVVVGSVSGGGWEITLGGDMLPSGSTGLAIQKTVGPAPRYLAYAVDPQHLYVADVTTLPGLTAADDLGTETTALPGGWFLQLAGQALVYTLTSGSGPIVVVDVAAPGPVGSISAGFTATTITAADFSGRAGQQLISVSAAPEPMDATATDLLVGFWQPGQVASYSLMQVRQGQKTELGAPMSITATPLETWTPTYSSALAVSSGRLWALLWFARQSPTPLYRLAALPVSEWAAHPPSIIDFDPASSGLSGFVVGQPTATLDAPSGLLCVYVASGASGWMLPLTCH